MLAEFSIGPKVGSDGVIVPGRASKDGTSVTVDGHSRFQEACLRGNLYSIGATSTALSANTITLTATTTPIVGVWNPSTSNVNLVILQAACTLTVAGNSAVAPGGFVWASSIGNNVITTGTAPFSRKTLSSNGSQAKGFPFVALTGLTNNLVIYEEADFGTLLVAQGATGTPIVSVPGVQNFDGSIIVPPGGVLALLNTVSTTTVSVASRLLWEEVPLNLS